MPHLNDSCFAFGNPTTYCINNYDRNAHRECSSANSQLSRRPKFPAADPNLASTPYATAPPASSRDRGRSVKPSRNHVKYSLPLTPPTRLAIVQWFVQVFLASSQRLAAWVAFVVLQT